MNDALNDTAAVIGKPLSRPDGRAKVTGAATYAAETRIPGLAYGAFVPAAIANGRVTAIDTAAALRASGVLRVLTHRDMPRLGEPPVPPVAQSFTPMQDDRVLYEGQPIALVVAERLEEAEHAARLVRAEYESAPVAVFGDGEAIVPKPSGYAFEPIDFTLGDIDAGLAQAEVRVEANYATPARHHNPMEPSATVAWWDGDDRLTLHTATQWTYGVRYGLAALFGLAPENIAVRCPFTGGGFGCKGYVWPHQILAAAAARIVRRPLKLALTRAEMYTHTGYQPAMRQTVTLGATRDGRLTGIRHISENLSSTFDQYIEYGVAGTRGIYAAPALHLVAKVEQANVGTPTAMRAPHEGLGMFALESAMDELAYELGVDPLELRLTNYAEVDPADGRPWSSKELRRCYLEGAERFGWSRRPMAPRGLPRDGRWLVGQGMASAMMTTFRFPAAARVRMRADGRIVVEAGTQDIGTGTYTIFPQIAAEVLGVDPSRIEMRLGDTGLPETGGTFGSSSTLAVGSAVKAAAENLRARLAELARAGVAQARPAGDNRPPLLYEDLLGQAGVEELVADGRWEFGAPFDAAGHASKEGRSMRSFGAVFVEVGVDPELGLVRLRRCVAGYSAGRIVNPKTARSQMIGGIIWGYGQAVLEESSFEPRLGRWLSKNLAGVALPVNADIPGDIDPFFVEEHDPYASGIGARGIGELGAVGVSAAIANAVFHATGKRVRALPIRMEDLLA